MQGFDITADMLKAILSLNNLQETHGVWLVFVREMQRIRDDNLSQSLHFIPSTDDVNSRERQDVHRGINICLDVLTHAFEDPASLLEEVTIVEKSVERQKDMNPF